MRRPQSTYRLQINEAFTLFDAAERLEALADLGVDWVYLSPLLEAEPGSDHGYDVVSHTRIDPARGGREGLDAVAEAARGLGMGVLVDIVPNHVGVATPEHNSWWWQVLRDGPESALADAFDIDWEAGGGKLLLPIVGDADWSEDGTVAHLSLADDRESLSYWETRLPVAPGTGDGTPQEVLERQHYRLGHWKQGDDQLNYRRFFAVSSLAAVRVELPEVFEATHVEIERWFDERLVQGLRVDHPDGLRDPAGYLDDLDRLTGGAFVLVEKILEPGEELPRWATAGTTGYDTLGLIDRVLTDGSAADALDAIDARLRGGDTVDWAAMTHGTKRRIADTILRAEVLRLEREVQAADAWGDTGAPADTADAIAELLACFPVYRSYLPDGLEHLGAAAERAKQHRPELAATIDALLPVLGNARQDAALRFQQTSGMVMAKGVEDTAFYRYSRLTSLNEVGGDPDVFAIEATDFHAFMGRRQAEWPHAMNALSTHDTKRGEDVRARITTIAEVPSTWDALLDKLLIFAPLEGRAFANLLLQALVGAWPASEERLVAYLQKAAREADAHTHWTDPNPSFESQLTELVRNVVDGPATGAIEEFLAATEAGFRSNVLSAKLLNLTIPGFPDLYQGSEALERSLVDPDNRRPVDWGRMDALRTQAREPLSGEWRSGETDLEVAKTRLVREALRLRRAHPERFAGYTPLLAHGDAAEHAIAYDRGGAIAVATRLPIALEARGGWGETTIRVPDGEWRELLTGRAIAGGAVPLAVLLGALPVALLTRQQVEERAEGTRVETTGARAPR